MATGTIHKGKPTGLLRWFFRLPIGLYRAHLGWLMGNRFIMLKHTGRKSGLDRYAVIEVVNHDSKNNIYTVASGWGEKSDWYQNIMKSPEVQISTYKGDLLVQSVRLSAEDGAGMLNRYAQRHPTSFRALVKMMWGDQAGDGQIDLKALAVELPVVSFIPHHN